LNLTHLGLGAGGRMRLWDWARLRVSACG